MEYVFTILLLFTLLAIVAVIVYLAWQALLGMTIALAIFALLNAIQKNE